MDDEQTLCFYANEAQAYAARYAEAHSRSLDRFLATLSASARILELGCGGGRDSAAMIELGFDAVATDGSPQMAAEASKRLGRPVRTLLFGELDEIAEYDGVWANACLLHVPFAHLPDIIRRIHCALRPGGSFYANYKTGRAEGRDKFGRYYNNPTEAALLTCYAEAADWGAIEIDSSTGLGYDDQPTDWLAIFAKRNSNV
ncbi:Methyltransferase domain-containing protein [Sphingobium sp. AP50]|uniref:class I SAM-dependent methyltransferase n=1 Tax=Sphingobium sp. AP50 TaxID=1884369 RepID=UPI0008AB1097|nr:class I SAM-dependent methyltransferase [Sphingobium sp. AP50]SEI99140.1 Methyltransferase domain-containing protein [Sphingobium sp. AP50]